jgi:hypothetical protein
VSPRPLTAGINDNQATSTSASMRKLSRSLRERGGTWGSAARGCGVGLQRRDGGHRMAACGAGGPDTGTHGG